MPKQKTHKGILKRVRVTASGKIKHPRAGGRHKRSHKTGDLLRDYRLSNYAHTSEARRIRKMLGLPTARPTRAAEGPDKGMDKGTGKGTGGKARAGKKPATD